MERKEFLKLAGAAAAGSLLTRCSTDPGGLERRVRRDPGLGQDLRAQAPAGLGPVAGDLDDPAQRLRPDRAGRPRRPRRGGPDRPLQRDGRERRRPSSRRPGRSSTGTSGEYAVRFGEIEAVGPGEHAAKAALDMAVLDWVGRTLDVPVWRLLGLGRDKAVTDDLLHRHRRGAGHAAEGPGRAPTSASTRSRSARPTTARSSRASGRSPTSPCGRTPTRAGRPRRRPWR